MTKRSIRVILFLWAALMTVETVFGAALYNPKAAAEGQTLLRPVQGESPNFDIEIHKINDLQLAVSNGGTFGIGFAGSYIDPDNGRPAPSCEFPAGSNVTYLYYGGLWAGAVVGLDTLVSIGIDDFYSVREFWPPPGHEGAIQRRSNMQTSLDYSLDAVSEQDFVCSFTDTFTSASLTGQDSYDNRPHIPLGLKVDQRTYGWSYDYAADFIMFDYTIRNINRFPIKQFYIGVFIDADVYHESHAGGTGYTDDICGYLNDLPARGFPGFRDTVRIAWTADNDGDPNPGAGNTFDYTSATGLTGTAVLRTPNPDLKYSFNWWITNYGSAALDWGPRKAGTADRPFRDFRYGLGTPVGDRNKYYVMSSQEFDYDQLESAVSHTGQGWLAPPRNAADFADGYDARYMFSFGPFDLQPGDTLPITLAYVAGSGFHVNGRDFIDNWDPYNPSKYESKLDFTDIGENAKWANWIFDNPGVDTDGDGDSGVYRLIIDTVNGGGDGGDFRVDTTRFWYRGDGVPDFRGAAPPPAPKISVTPEFGRLRVRWNGQISEENVDFFSGLKDFEGYRVYYAENNRASDYVLLSGYDIDDFNVYHFNTTTRLWEISESPITRDSLARWLGADFDPEPYDRPEASFFSDGQAYYFVPQDWNRSDLTNPRGIHRVYPDADANDASDTTSEGFLRYYEYEYILDGIQPSVPYYVSVTSFDYGSRKIALSSLESSPNLSAVQAYPLPSSESVEQWGLSVIVYPNPYRIDGGYAETGYENRDRTKSAERSRSIHFANLPKICTIRIYTLSGDLVRQIDHYDPEGGPESQHERWNLISRNTQAVVTGLYIWHVSSDMGEQLGKIVVIK